MFNHANILANLISNIPIFKNDFGFKIQIEIITEKNSSISICIRAFNDKNELVRLGNLEKSHTEFFIKEYRNFVYSGKYNKSKSIIGAIKTIIPTLKGLQKSKQLCDFGFSVYHGLPLVFIDELYTIDKFDDNCLAKTVIENGKMINIFNSEYLENPLAYFHILSLQMIFQINKNESRYYLQIFERLASIFTHIIPILTSIFILRNVILEWNNPYHNLSVYTFIFYLSIFIISFFSKLVLKVLLYFFINKNFFTSTMDKKIISIFNNISKFKLK